MSNVTVVSWWVRISSGTGMLLLPVVMMCAMAYDVGGDGDIDTRCIYEVSEDPISPCKKPAGAVSGCPDCETKNGNPQYNEYSGVATHSGHELEPGNAGNGVQSFNVDCWKSVSCVQSAPMLDHWCVGIVRDCHEVNPDLGMFCRTWAAQPGAWNRKLDYQLVPCIATHTHADPPNPNFRMALNIRIVSLRIAEFA
jgi:hypothetical protein